MPQPDPTLALTLQRPVSAPHRWFLGSIMILTIALGWQYPVIGYVVPVAMAAGIGGSFARGRYVCGNFCPRGSFFDTFFRLVGGNRPVPPLLRSLPLRWTIFTLLMGFMAWQITLNPADPLHWGFVFWMACTVTTAVGLGLGLLYRARSWCVICPVGTMANAIGGHTWPLRIDTGCRACGSCERHCPMGLTIASHREAGLLPHRDCIKCSSCVDSCRAGALSFPQ